MKRLRYSVISIISFTMACNNIKEEQETKRPNILFIMSDDHAYQAISAYSDKLIKTTNIDRLASEGILFTNACVTNSICAPSRATILTGKHCHIHGKVDNEFPFDTSQMTFPRIFQKAGYKTAIFGKLHFGNNPKGVDDYMIVSGQGNYFNPHFINPSGDTTIMGYATDLITDHTIDWLENNRSKDEPFMMMCLYKAPHRHWWPRIDKFMEYSKKKFPVPETLFDDYKNRGTAAKEAEMNLLHNMKYSGDNKVWPEIIDEMELVLPRINQPKNNAFYHAYNRLTAEEKKQYQPVIDSISNWFKNNWNQLTNQEKMQWKYQRYMQDYLACVSTVDDNIGRLMEYMKKSGLDKNTLIVYTSDQGFFLGEHGWYDKRFIYEESFRTPLMMKWNGVIEPGSTSSEMVQNLDFAPTFLEAAGIDIPENMQGESLMPLLTNNEIKWTRDAVYYHFYEYPGWHMVKRHYGVVTEEYKLVHFYYDIDEWEFYDRINDPFELYNAYNDTAYADAVKEMKVKLKEVRNKYGDSDELNEMYLKTNLVKEEQILD